MAIPKKLINYLAKHDINYEAVAHKTVYTAFDLAKTTKSKLFSIAKTLAVKIDNKYALVVLPASHRLELSQLKKILKAKKIVIVKEVELTKVFKIKPGAIVPFVSFHNVPVYVDKNLLKSKVLLISSGSHRDSIKIKAKILIDKGGEALAAVSKKYFADIKINKKSTANKTKKIIPRLAFRGPAKKQKIGR